MARFCYFDFTNKVSQPGQDEEVLLPDLACEA